MRAAIDFDTIALRVIQPDEVLVAVFIEPDSAVLDPVLAESPFKLSQFFRGADAESEMVSPIEEAIDWLLCWMGFPRKRP